MGIAEEAAVAKWHHDALCQKVVKALKKNDFDAVYIPDRNEAVQYIMSHISKGSTVAIGGSVTVTGLNIPELARQKGAKLITIYEPDLSAEEMVLRMREQLTSDVFLSSVNALTLDGFLINVDSAGNRIAAMTFGPKKVVLVVGVNKICADIDSAFQRLELIAGPKNNKRINLYKNKIELNNPCSITGICSDCRSKTRICRIYSITKRRPTFTDITVLVVGENLGY